MVFVKKLNLFPCFLLMQNTAIKKLFIVLKQKEAEFEE